jgi:REP element-mobilizing transposase RayT
MHAPGRGEGALRRHRISCADTSYFLTLCCNCGHAKLCGEKTATAIRNEIDSIEADGHWVIRAAVIMPDHLHLLIRLHGKLSLSRCVARLKSKTRSALSSHLLSWQANFYEHRLRPDDLVEAVVHYIFLNPYRAQLVSSGSTYRWFWLGPEERNWFEPIANDGQPLPDWLR